MPWPEDGDQRCASSILTIRIDELAKLHSRTPVQVVGHACATQSPGECEPVSTEQVLNGQETE